MLGSSQYTVNALFYLKCNNERVKDFFFKQKRINRAKRVVLLGIPPEVHFSSNVYFANSSDVKLKTENEF